MAKEKAKAGVPANPRDIEWPRDTLGVSADLKKAITLAAGKMNGQPDKLAILLKVLEIGFAHVQARYESQTEENKRAAEWREQAAAEAEQRNQPKGYRAF